MKVSILALAVGALFCDKALYSPPSTYGSDAPLPQSFAAYGAVSQNDLESIPE